MKYSESVDSKMGKNERKTYGQNNIIESLILHSPIRDISKIQKDE